MEIHFFDYVSVELLFVLTVVLMLLMLEVGFRFGSMKKSKKVKAQTAQVGRSPATSLEICCIKPYYLSI